MKYIRLFSSAEAALGETKTPVVFYLKGAPKPIFASKKQYGDTCTIVIDETEGSVGIKACGLTIIFKDNEGNIISEKEYKSGETIIVPEAPVKSGLTFLGWGDVEIDKAVTNMTFIAQYEVTPKVTITMNDSYTDGSSIALNAVKTETVTGDIEFSVSLPSDVYHTADNVLIFDKHYEGSVTITASAIDKHSNIQSDSKTITVSCDVADTVNCVISNVTADDVEADAISAIIKYDCNVTTTTHAGVSNTVVAHKEKTVTFESNESEEDVTRSGLFTCEHGETVEWIVAQKGYKEQIPSDNEIWYKTNNSVVIVPMNMSPTTNEYTDKGVMTFADNITSIAQSAFKSKSTLTEFYGGMSLTSVGSSAFYSCSSLTRVNLPNCISVGSNAFYSCYSLTSINLPNCTTVDGYAFAHCSRLTSIDLPKCTSVGSYAFAHCSRLTSIDLPNCTSFGNSAFFDCSNLSKFTGLLATEDNRCLMSNGTILAFAPAGLTSYTIEDCTSVGSSAFEYCSSLTSVNLPNCTSVGGYAFYSCYSLTSVNLPNCTYVGSYAFHYCSSLTSINLPNCTSVGSNAFYSCTRLTSIDLPKCTSVGGAAFAHCSRLTSINLPNCTSVGGAAFVGCTNLSKFTGLLATEDNRCLMSDGTIYAFAPSRLTSYTREDCTSVGVYAFEDCSSLTSINLPNCTSVGSSAFEDCSSLTSINLPNCTTVDGYAFYKCSSLTSIDLPNCTTVRNCAFAYCSRLTSVNLPNCTYVGGYAFSSCTSLTSINLPNCTSVGGSAFYNCYSLTSINLPNCTSVGSSAFRSCTSLTTVTLGASTMCSLSNSNAFSGCTRLTSIYVTASLVNTYKTDSKWKYYSSKIVPIEE